MKFSKGIFLLGIEDIRFCYCFLSPSKIKVVFHLCLVLSCAVIAIHLYLANTGCQMNIYYIYTRIVKNNYRFLNAYPGNVNTFYEPYPPR